jgi:site-specific recombinase XerD
MNETDIKVLKQRDTDYMVGCGASLWLRVRKSGRKTFVVRRKQAGKTKVITLGDWPTLSLKAATLRAVTVKTPGDATMNDLVQEYKDAVISHHKRPKQFDCYAARIKKAVGNIRVTEVSAKRLSEFVAESRATPRAADSLRSHLRAMFSLSIELGWRNDNPATVIGARVTGYKYEPITRVLTHDEIRQLWAMEGNNAALLRFLLLTGLRISEGQTGYEDGDMWRMDRTKNSKPHWVFLTPTAKAQLIEPFRVSTTAVQAWIRRKQKFIETAWTPHDLRRTFATLAMENGVLPHVVEKCLNHALEGMLRIYAHAEMTEERIAAANTVERVILGITGATGSAGR